MLAHGIQGTALYNLAHTSLPITCRYPFLFDHTQPNQTPYSTFPPPMFPWLGVTCPSHLQSALYQSEKSSLTLQTRWVSLLYVYSTTSFSSHHICLLFIIFFSTGCKIPYNQRRQPLRAQPGTGT